VVRDQWLCFVGMTTEQSLSVLLGQWEIEMNYGLEALGRFLFQVEGLKSGVVQKDEIIREKKALAATRVFFADGSDMMLEDGGGFDGLSEGVVAHMRLEGAMRLSDGWCTEGVRSFGMRIDEAGRSENVRGLVLEVNSGGGESVAGTELQNAVRDFVDRGKPVYVYGQQVLSAALRGVLPATKIYMSGGSSFVGSVGTMYTVDNRLLEIVRKNFTDIYARQSTLKNDEFRELVKGNVEPLIDMLSENAQVFIDEVSWWRDIQGSQSEELYAGKTMRAKDGLGIGLIDGVKSFGEVVREVSGVVIEGKRRNNFFLYGNNQEMKMKDFTGWFSQLTAGLNEKLGLGLEENADPEQVLEALNGAASIGEVKDSVNENLEQVREEFNEKLLELEGKLGDLEEKTKELEEQKVGMEEKIVDLKSKLAEGSAGVEGNAGQAPDRSQFQTGERVRLGAPEGTTSKY